MSPTVAQYWEEQAACFDDQPDHGLLEPAGRLVLVEGFDDERYAVTALLGPDSLPDKGVRC